MNGRSAQCGLFLENRRFCVNVLVNDHQELAGYFAGKQTDMAARYAAAKWIDMPSGS